MVTAPDQSGADAAPVERGQGDTTMPATTKAATPASDAAGTPDDATLVPKTSPAVAEFAAQAAANGTAAADDRRAAGGRPYTPLQRLQAAVERIERALDEATELVEDVPAENVPGLDDTLTTASKAVEQAFNIARKAVRAERKARVGGGV
jgi:hypothetical protein